jgi:hypothetical protein
MRVFYCWLAFIALALPRKPTHGLQTRALQMRLDAADRFLKD